MTEQTTKKRDFHAWNVTAEQAQEIAQGDEAAAALFFHDNFSKLRGMACNYARKNNFAYGYELYNPIEMLNQLYIDLPHLCWQNGQRLTWDILCKSFRWSPHGGFTQRVEMGLPIRERDKRIKERISDPTTLCLHFMAISLETPLENTDGKKTIADTIAAPPDDEVTPPPVSKSAAELVEILGNLFNPAEREVLALYLDGKNYVEIAKIRGVAETGACNGIKRVKQKLIVNYKEVLRRLLANGVSVSHYLQTATPDNLEEAAIALERKREQTREHSKEMRAKARREAQATAAKNAPKAV